MGARQSQGEFSRSPRRFARDDILFSAFTLVIPIEFGQSYTKSRTKGVGFHVKDRFTIGRLSLMLGLRAETQEILNDLGETVWSWGQPIRY